MKILFVSDSDYPWDIRIEKICRTLIEHGYELHLVCRNMARRPVEEVYQDIYIHRLPYLPKIFGTLNNLFTFPAFFSPVWLFHINRIAREHRVDAILVRDLPMSLAAILIARLNDVPIIIDMAECYPELIRLIWQFEPMKIQNILVRNPFLADKVEQIATKYADHIFVMIEEAKERFIRKGITQDKLTIVSNTPYAKRFSEITASYPGVLYEQKGKMIMIYVGFINHSRGLDTIIKSLHKYVSTNKNIYLALLGTGSAEQYLKKLTKNLSLENHIGFAGWIDNRKVPEYIASADICLVPHHKCGHWDHTIPNKLFDYMAAGKAVLVSDVEPMKRIVNQNKCGLVYKDGDIDSFVSQLSSLEDVQIRTEYGHNGMSAVLKQYNWDMDSARMLRSIAGCLR